MKIKAKLKSLTPNTEICAFVSNDNELLVINVSVLKLKLKNKSALGILPVVADTAKYYISSGIVDMEAIPLQKVDRIFEPVIAIHEPNGSTLIDGKHRYCAAALYAEHMGIAATLQAHALSVDDARKFDVKAAMKSKLKLDEDGLRGFLTYSGYLSSGEA
ncbi:hypothetical protein OKW76_00390 [Sphingomonas sp. S1-29]|uniref:hypothetical protein n=1 Tax=Sphingomonas sp. S1-29 TaxID=2991074 RepID=UPI00223F450F|nr:hypothetical protein [Sphingomonas sp. S1-29]UZK69583.1 hypothetical protein OKW76_00390 [Sphingomonas sp. S1-29]